MSRRRLDYISLVPKEIVSYNIFSRLPVKSLGSCKCVSKSWNSLISDPHFIKTHLTKTSKDNDTTHIILISTKPNPHSLYSVYVDNKFGRNIPYEFGPKLKFDCSNTWSRIWGSCDGLILAEDNKTWTTMYLLNPTTLESKRLPVLPSGCRNTWVFGFGYDISLDDYAIVAIASCQDSFKKQACVYVYSLKRDKWNNVGLSPYDHKGNKPVAGIYVGGCLHWLAKNVNDSSWLISAFNISSKEFSQVLVPVPVTLDTWRLGVLKGCLCMISYDFGLPTELWVMKEYGVAESWIKLSIFTEGHIFGVPLHWPDDTLGVLESSMVCLLVTNEEAGEFCIYKRGFGSQPHGEFGMTYVDSLVSPSIFDGFKKKNRGRRSKTMK